MTTKIGAQRGTGLALVAGVAVLFLFLVTPAPAEAAACEACTWDLYCVGGASCWLLEYCTTGKVYALEYCYVDQWGYCHDGGQNCYLADVKLRQGGDPFQALQPEEVERACQVSQLPGSASSLNS